MVYIQHKKKTTKDKPKYTHTDTLTLSHLNPHTEDITYSSTYTMRMQNLYLKQNSIYKRSSIEVDKKPLQAPGEEATYIDVYDN